MPLDQDAIENALQAWLTAETGLQVVLADQSGPRLSQTFATLKVTLGPTQGFPAELRTGDNPSPSGNGGDEVEQDLILQREVVASAQVFTVATTGNTSAQALLTKAQMGLEKPTRRAALRAVGLALFDRGVVQNVTAVLETRFEGRAVLQVRFRTVDMTSETTGYIATANVTPTFS